MRCIAFLLLVACAARAQDSLVERLETELRALAKNADAAADEAFVAIGAQGTYRLDGTISLDAKWPQVVDALRVVQGQLPGAAILVGTPPRVVAAYSAVGDADRLPVRLVDGRDVVATRWDGDDDLGVVVFKLPDDVAKDLKGVDVEGDWARIGVGSIAVATDGRGRGGPRLGLVTAADPRLGMIDAPGDGAAVFGSRGTLIGLRGGADMASCAACHQAANAALGHLVDERGQVLASDWALEAWTQAKAQAAHRDQRLLGALVNYDRRFQPAGQRSGHLVAGPVIRRVLDDLEKFGAIQHAFLGVVVGDVAGERAVQIVTVVGDSPAAAAGLAPGAKIDAVDGLSCPSAAFFSRAIVLHRPGDEVTLSIGGREIKVRLCERDAARVNVASAENVGLSCVELGADLRRFLGFPADLRGVVVEEVAAGSPAEKAGIQRGDVITTGDGSAIPDLEGLNAALAGAKGKIEFSGLRSSGGSRRSATVWAATVTVPEPQGR